MIRVITKPLLSTILLFVTISCTNAQSCLELLDLSRQELSDVRREYESGNRQQALALLKEYYLKRTDIVVLNENSVCNRISESQKKSAQNALEHKFTVLDSYGPISYGTDINWEYWPIRDLELRWQLHRMHWWSSLGKAYRFYKDEKYAEEWVNEYCDWINKNPLKNYDPSMAKNWGSADNQYFAWRPLETGIRLRNQIDNFIQMRDAKCFTPEFLDVFLVNYHRHMEHLHKFYTPSCNHRITEAQGMLYASVFFPEFKDSKMYRDEAISILNEEINKQVYGDGMQIELDPGYHFIAISTFYEVVKFCELNNVFDAFPETYMRNLRNMVDIARRFVYPDHTIPLFSDTRQLDAGVINAYLSSWAQLVPEEKTNLASKAFAESGFYSLCNGFDMNSTIMTVKAGPPAYYHCQPDNGTFEYWRKGRNFFPDSGCYLYSGDDSINAMREWFRQTKVHNTLTLDGKNLEKTNSRLLFFKNYSKKTVLKIQNQSYQNLLHERNVSFYKDGTVEIIDIATGLAEGVVQINYNLSEGDWIMNDGGLVSNYSDGNNISLTVTSSFPIEVKEEEGRISRKFGEYAPRPSYSFYVKKGANDTVIFKTIIRPIEE